MTEVSLIAVGAFDPKEWGIDSGLADFFALFHGDIADILILQSELKERFPNAPFQKHEVQWSTTGPTKWAITVWLERKEAIQVRLLYT